MFKPSKNFQRGFHQWMFLRGQEIDPQRSGPVPSQDVIDRYLPQELQNERRVAFLRQCLMNMHDRVREEDYFNARVMIEAARWLEQNRDAEDFFLVVESFDPHEPWFVPEHYRKMYDPGDGPEQVLSAYSDRGDMSPGILRRTRANYQGLVTMCDRWFGHLFETLRSLSLLENTILIVTSDHGHSIGDRNYTGKRGYPARPEVLAVPLIVRHPEGEAAGTRSNTLVQHTDIAAQVLEFAGVKAPDPIHGVPFFDAAGRGERVRDHATVGWGTGMTVIDDAYWFNSKIDSSGAFLYDLGEDPAMERNVADERRDEARRLYHLGVEDAGGSFPGYLEAICANQSDAPGCSALAARE
jgi:arylsulfatase A-like enzyme